MKTEYAVYHGNPNLKAEGVAMQFTDHEMSEYMKCASDPIYFIEKYVKIVNLDEGLTDFNMYDFQKKMVRSFHENRFTICKLPRQSGKTSTGIGFLLHYVLFNAETTVAILANKEKTAREILHRLQTAYENLPFWLQQGVVAWNKGSIELENKSRIVASSTSSSAIRGGSFNIIFLDEFAFVPFEVAEEFFASVYPTITSGKNTKVIMVSTPKGMNLFYKYWVDAIHSRNGYVPIEINWYDVPGRGEKFKEETIANTSPEQWQQEFECDFLGTAGTLITPEKLKAMPYANPIRSNTQGLKVYDDPVDDKIYIICVDVSRGVGQDYHAFTVIDITSMPYKVVATFRNNSLPTLVFPSAIYPIAKLYNNAFIGVEINDIGGQVADILKNDYEYDNMLSTTVRGRKGQILGEGFGSGTSMPGIRTTIPVKRVGCSVLKSLITEDKLLITDYDIIKELTTFVYAKGTYGADKGYNDDLVMTLVIFSWITSQEYFKELLNLDVRTSLYKDKIAELEEEMTPFGFILDGLDDEETTFVDATGQQWNTDISEGDNQPPMVW